MKVQNIIGADISKKTIDLVNHTTSSYVQIENTAVGFRAFIDWAVKEGICWRETMIVMEHTGLYSTLFEAFLQSNAIAFKKVSALEIKRSAGLVRGKSDKVDAARIAIYGYERKHKLQVDTSLPADISRLKMLYSTRDRLVKTRAGLINAVKEYRHVQVSEKDILIQSQLKVIKALDKQIETVQQSMDSIVDKDQSLSRNYQLLQTIKGVGKIVALAVLIKTNNFTKFKNARKFACYCGTAPFEHSSGTSIRKRTRVSHLADKEMKTLLDLAAKSAIRFDPELCSYYQRRTGIGKAKMSTINIVRNKIIYRMFAVIKRQTPFMDNYLEAA